MLDRLLQALTCDFAIDLGTANTLVHVRGQGLVVNEPSVVAYRGEGNGRRVIAVGTEAKAMLGKTPQHLYAAAPLRAGVIADYELTRLMLEAFIAKARASTGSRARGRVLLSVPAQLSSIDMRAVRDAVTGTGIRQVLVIEQPIAAAVGAGLSLRGYRGSMIVDIGGGTTDVAVVAHGGRVISSSLRVAGNTFDEAITQHVRRTQGVVIGARAAERLKVRLGSAVPLANVVTAEVNAQDLTGWPRIVEVTSTDVHDALAEPIRQLAAGCRANFERIPPELAADIHTGGIILCGGGALLHGMDVVIGEACGVPVELAENPLHTVLDGIATVMDDLPRYRGLLM